MRIYRQAMKDSVVYSKRVSITRVSDISADSATLYTGLWVILRDATQSQPRCIRAL